MNAIGRRCCWGCYTDLINAPASLAVMIRTRVSLDEIGNYLYETPEVTELRESMDINRWNEVKYLAHRAVLNKNILRENTETLHKRFGQAKQIQFSSKNYYNIEGNLELGSVLEVVCQQRHTHRMGQFFSELAEEVVQPHVALKALGEGPLNLESAVSFDLYTEKFKVFYPTTSGCLIREFPIPGHRRDLESMQRRIRDVLTYQVRRWRAVFFENIWGIGNPDEANRGFPLAREWIQTIKGLKRDSWIIIGAAVSEERRFISLNEMELKKKINFFNFVNVNFLNLTQFPRRGFKMSVVRPYNIRTRHVRHRRQF